MSHHLLRVEGTHIAVAAVMMMVAAVAAAVVAAAVMIMGAVLVVVVHQTVVSVGHQAMSFISSVSLNTRSEIYTCCSVVPMITIIVVTKCTC